MRHNPLSLLFVRDNPSVGPKLAAVPLSILESPAIRATKMGGLAVSMDGTTSPVTRIAVSLRHVQGCQGSSASCSASGS